GLLCPGRAHGARRRAGRKSEAVGGRYPVRHPRQPLPLHRLHEDAGGEHRSGGRRVRQGSLNVMAVMKTTREVKGVGLAIPRPDGPEKVTGQVQYVADIKPKGMLHAKLLRSPHAHARIVKIDTTRARALPGVRAVLTAR